ncbi:hypothetical protein P3T73_11430 [Kiritimatiellota bacterium B12222]|nr:hypothetical protein P3T73_11430 [Kiritimatiellota bacterium B12222]
MKFKLLLLICFLGVSSSAAETSPWVFGITYGFGYSEYQEDVRLGSIDSEWSALSSSLGFTADFRGKYIMPMIRVRILGSESETETWTENGIIAQKNELVLGQGDLFAGLAPTPLKIGKGTFIPYVGISYRYQIFMRDDFENYAPSGILVEISTDQVNEEIDSWATGAGIVFEIPLSELWNMGFQTEYLYILDTQAYNQGFHSEVEGEGGWIWESHISIAKKLSHPGQQMGIRVTADYQSIQGGQSTEIPGAVIEWPDNQWANVGLQLFWSGAF